MNEKLYLPNNETCRDCTSFKKCKSFYDNLENNHRCRWVPNEFEHNVELDINLDKLAFTLLLCDYCKKDILALRERDINKHLEVWNKSMKECNGDRYTCLPAKIKRYYKNAKIILNLIGLSTLNNKG